MYIFVLQPSYKHTNQPTVYCVIVTFDLVHDITFILLLLLLQ